MIINVWLAVRDSTQVPILERATWNEETQGVYTGPITERQRSVFRLMGDLSVLDIFRKDVIAGGWTLWTLNFDIARLNARGEVTQIIADFPGAIRVIGGWDFNTGAVVTGFPIHPRILEFIPDIDNIGTRPTVPSDVNLSLGQTPRQF